MAANSMGLGPYVDFTLDEARERARLARQLLKDGIDPIDTAHEARAKAAKASAQLVTFKEAAQKYYEFHSPKWRNEKDSKMFNARFEAYVYPLMGALPVGGIVATRYVRFVPIVDSCTAAKMGSLFDFVYRPRRFSPADIYVIIRNSH